MMDNNKNKQPEIPGIEVEELFDIDPEVFETDTVPAELYEEE